MRKALVVGINNYPNLPLSGCVNDALSIATLLEVDGDGSPNCSVRLITSPNTLITRAVLREAIDNLFSGEPDMAVLFFAGHGYIKSTGVLGDRGCKEV